MNNLKQYQQIKPLKNHFDTTPPVQLSLFSEIPEAAALQKPVNIASVPHRSPFRYPGGKTWFVPTFREWVKKQHSKPEILIEPFTGGGSISLTALFENLVSQVVMVEIDEDISAVWKSVVGGQAEWLATRILSFELTKESVINEISRTDVDIKEKAFQTILRNRTSHGGIMAEGSGMVKYGENGKGLSSRWYPATLAKRFIALNTVSDKIEYRQDDGLKVIQEYAQRKDVIFFIDPPYTAGGKKAGKRLYRHCNIDHKKLFELCKIIKGDFIMTYDNADEVKEMALNYGFEMRLIPMTNTHNTTMEELVIGKDLSWMVH